LNATETTAATSSTNTGAPAFIEAERRRKTEMYKRQSLGAAAGLAGDVPARATHAQLVQSFRELDALPSPFAEAFRELDTGLDFTGTFLSRLARHGGRHARRYRRALGRHARTVLRHRGDHHGVQQQDVVHQRHHVRDAGRPAGRPRSRRASTARDDGADDPEPAGAGTHGGDVARSVRAVGAPMPTTAGVARGGAARSRSGGAQ
jgi:hypothetical protein